VNCIAVNTVFIGFLFCPNYSAGFAAEVFSIFLGSVFFVGLNFDQSNESNYAQPAYY